MLVGSLPFVPQPANNIAQLHTLILKGCEIPDSLSEGEDDNLYMSTWIKTKYINIKSCKQPYSNFALQLHPLVSNQFRVIHTHLLINLLLINGFSSCLPLITGLVAMLSYTIKFPTKYTYLDIISYFLDNFIPHYKN